MTTRNDRIRAALRPEVPDHPAKWSESVLTALHDVIKAESERVGRPLRILDPFAGVGRARLADALDPYAHGVDGVELQPEWSVDADPDTMQGDATNLPIPAGSYDAVCTSPCYGNRCADHHDAKDPCKACSGTGDYLPSQDDCDPPCATRPCPTCKGTGLSWRNTYAHALRRAGGDLVPGSAAAMAWGRDYRILHRTALDEMLRVLIPGGFLAINMSNHFRTLKKGQPAVEQDVVGWWVNRIIVAGCILRGVVPVSTPRNRKGANAEVRAECEYLITAHTPNPRKAP